MVQTSPKSKSQCYSSYTTSKFEKNNSKLSNKTHQLEKHT